MFATRRLASRNDEGESSELTSKSNNSRRHSAESGARLTALRKYIRAFMRLRAPIRGGFKSATSVYVFPSHKYGSGSSGLSFVAASNCDIAFLNSPAK